MNKLIIAALSTLAFIPPAGFSAQINWGSATAVSSVADVINIGELVEAFNAGADGVEGQTVNTVPFTGTGTLMPLSSASDAFSGTTGDTAYDALLSTIDYGGGAGLNTVTVGGGNLTVGSTYMIQVWFADTRYADRQMDFGDGNGNTVRLTSSPGQYAVGTFTADGSTQSFTYDAVNIKQGHMNAYQVRTASSAPVPSLTTATNFVTGAFTVNGTFSEAVTGLEESDFNISNGTITSSSITDSNDVFSIVVTPSGNGDVTVLLPAGSVTDLDGNSSLDSNEITVFYLAPGSERPTAVLSTPGAFVGGSFSIDVVFSEPVTGLAVGDFTVVNGSVVNVAGSNAVYTAEITPALDGLEITGDNDSYVRVSLPENVVTDLDGDQLGNTASEVAGAAYAIPENPDVVLHGTLNSDTTDCKVYITFSQEVTGFDAGDLTVVNGTVFSVETQGRSYSHEGYYASTNSKYYAATIIPSAPGTVEVTVPAGAAVSAYDAGYANTASDTLCFEYIGDFGEQWIVDEAAAWSASTLSNSNLSIADGFAEPTGDNSRFTSVVKKFPARKKARRVTFGQSPAWQNWTQSETQIGAAEAGDAPILLSIGDKDYYHLGKYTDDGYHAWHSTNMVDWVHHGQITTLEHRWVTTAEYKDGRFYIFLDYPNDHTPHLYIDDDLKDGTLGSFQGMVFNDPSHGSDSSVIRDNADGLFHIISEDWTPIEASTHAWDSPINTHASSATATNGFTPHEHVPPIDMRTVPTGTYASYNHPHVADTHISNPCFYEIHEPDQEAFGDWTSIKVGKQYYMFSDFDNADGSTMSCALFTSDSIYEQYERVNDIKCGGHPDPTIGFAEGKFYLITQKNDFTSPGPWVEGVEARAGVDTDGDGSVDQWTAWQTIREQYDHTPGYARVVTTTPAQIDLSELPAGYGFQFEFRVDDTVVSGVSPIMDSVVLDFEPNNYQQWANTNGIPAEAQADNNTNGIPDLIEFSIGQTVVPARQADGTLTVTAVNEAIEDGLEVQLWFADSLLESWEAADAETAGVRLLSDTPDLDGSHELVFEILDRNGTSIFWKLVVVAPE